MRVNIFCNQSKTRFMSMYCQGWGLVTLGTLTFIPGAPSYYMCPALLWHLDTRLTSPLPQPPYPCLSMNNCHTVLHRVPSITDRILCLARSPWIFIWRHTARSMMHRRHISHSDDVTIQHSTCSACNVHCVMRAILLWCSSKHRPPKQFGLRDVGMARMRRASVAWMR